MYDFCLTIPYGVCPLAANVPCSIRTASFRKALTNTLPVSLQVFLIIGGLLGFFMHGSIPSVRVLLPMLVSILQELALCCEYLRTWTTPVSLAPKFYS
jgi:hypothetical protein